MKAPKKFSDRAMAKIILAERGIELRGKGFTDWPGLLVSLDASSSREELVLPKGIYLTTAAALVQTTPALVTVKDCVRRRVITSVGLYPSRQGRASPRRDHPYVRLAWSRIPNTIGPPIDARERALEIAETAAGYRATLRRTWCEVPANAHWPSHFIHRWTHGVGFMDVPEKIGLRLLRRLRDSMRQLLAGEPIDETSILLLARPGDAGVGDEGEIGAELGAVRDNIHQIARHLEMVRSLMSDRQPR